MSNDFESKADLWDLARAYLTAKEAVIHYGFSYEIDWQNQLSIELLTERTFLRESAWVILSSGMRESVIRSKFSSISNAFYQWESAESIAKKSRHCKTKALKYFNHSPKIDAIITIARHIDEAGFENVFNRIKDEGINYISKFPFMGPATSFHLAKNIGLQVAKPDRHLQRIADITGYNSPNKMCSEISDLIGDKVSVVDLVLWRYATLFKNYLEIFPTPTEDKFDLEDCGICFLNYNYFTTI